MDNVIFIFKRNKSVYVIPADSIEDAWNQLQKKLSINIKFVKQRCKFIGVCNKFTEVKL